MWDSPGARIVIPSPTICILQVSGTCHCGLNWTKKPDLLSAYEASFQEFIQQEYVEKAPYVANYPEYYLPHHPVVKESLTTYKTRPVFDASAKDQHDVLPTDCLLPGLSLVQQLLDVMVSFASMRSDS